MLPYPSGDLHTGHWYAMTPSDARARFYRMNGYNVFFPIGFDAFGLPAENAAIRHGVHPKEWTYANIERMRQQLRKMGAMWAWDREAVSCDPEYYKWSQWFFLKFYDAGLAYRDYAPVDWCPSCNTTLAREQVWGDDRHCERCGTPVVKKNLNQWKFRITNYADELIDGLNTIEWPERVKAMQTNWIGRSEGAEATFNTEAGDDLVIFTTRPDTLWGATFMVLAPEHPAVDNVTSPEQKAAVEAYKEQAARLDEIERGAADKEKTGVFTGGYAINPVNDERIPIWIADYVMMGYGTGAIMAVPAHDQRDFDFATRYGLEIRRVITGPDGATGPLSEAYDSKTDGVMINSGAFDGTPVDGLPAPSPPGWRRPAQQVRRQLPPARLADQPPAHVGRAHPYHLLRQVRHGPRPLRGPARSAARRRRVPAYRRKPSGLSRRLPEREVPAVWRRRRRRDRHHGHLHVLHTGITTPTSALTGKRARRSTPATCPGARRARITGCRSTSTPAASSTLPCTCSTRASSPRPCATWASSTSMNPCCASSTKAPILGPDGEKMSKSRGNVVNPDDYVERYGADTVRGYLMFIGPGNWADHGTPAPSKASAASCTASGPSSSTRRRLGERRPGEEEVRNLERKLHQTIIKVTDDMQNFRFNTAIAALMEMNNWLVRTKDTAIYDTRPGAKPSITSSC